VGLFFVEDLDPYPPIISISSRYGWSPTRQVPVPPYARPDPSADAHLCIVDRVSGEEWDFWEVRGTYPDFSCGTSSVMDVHTDGVRVPYVNSSRESGFPLMAGLVRPEEIQHNQIRHALVYAFDARNSADNSLFVWPAAWGAGNDFGPNGDQVLPMGARLQLRPEVNISGLTPAAQVIATALKEYGMYLGEEGDGMSMGIYMQTVGDEDGDGVAEGWDELWAGIWTDADRNSLATLDASDFRVIQLPPLGGEPPGPTPEPTATPVPTSTLAPTNTPEPTVTPTPTDTPEPLESARILFLHHSVGRITYAYDVSNPFDGYVDNDCSDGDCDGLARWFYQNTDHEIKEVEWPWGHGQNDPQVYKDIWAGSGCSEAAPKLGSEATRAEIGNVCSLDDLDGFDVIVFKTCFTESGIDNATRQRYMANYQVLGELFDQYPDKTFIAWNLFPNLSGTAYDRQFSEWLRDEWASQHPNVFVWDVFEYMTYGGSNSFYSGYAWGDNHPTPQAGRLLALGGTNAANEDVIGLGEFIVEAIEGR
jgi:hypothetical protein